MCPSSNTRWCPTPEQLMVLEELYRRGLRTPNASQIQKITAHLSLYGKIQGKNVFYWFQNHKARDRQKLRKRHLLHQQHQHLLHHHQFPAFHFPPPQNYAIPFPGEEEAPGGGGGGGVTRVQAWRSSDHPKDCLMRTYGHDSVMIMGMGVGPTTSQPPLRTLELFPLTSPTESAADLQERASASS